MRPHLAMLSLRATCRLHGLACLLTLGILRATNGGVTVLQVHYSPAMQPLVKVSVGGQVLQLVFDASSGNTAVFVREEHACTPLGGGNCYSYDAALQRGTVTVCEENQKIACNAGSLSEYKCNDVFQNLHNLSRVKAHVDELIIDGLQFAEKGIEARDEVSIGRYDDDTDSVVPANPWPNMPVRLLVQAMSARVPHGAVGNGSRPVLPLFVGTDGVLGASGPSLSCRNDSVWGRLLRELDAKMFAIDLRPPPQVLFGHDNDEGGGGVINGRAASRVVLNHVDPRWSLLWSQPKQSGDIVNDGMHEFLMYHPQVCGVDLLYSTSSNWLSVIDTSGACLSLPAFLFDRLRTHIPIACPFVPGESAAGRLCSPVRSGGSPSRKARLLPALYFRLNDVQDPQPPWLYLPLERLVFKDGSQEFLCVARSDDDRVRSSADMMFAHIAMGSLAVSAFYTVVDLQSRRIGLAPRATDPNAESSDDGCATPVTCSSPMQTYFAPSNQCEDPDCSEYIGMRFDNDTKMCTWSKKIPISFGFLLVILAVLDLISHRLYKRAIEKASDFPQ